MAGRELTHSLMKNPKQGELSVTCKVYVLTANHMCNLKKGLGNFQIFSQKKVENVRVFLLRGKKKRTAFKTNCKIIFTVFNKMALQLTYIF